MKKKKALLSLCIKQITMTIYKKYIYTFDIIKQHHIKLRSTGDTKLTFEFWVFKPSS